MANPVCNYQTLVEGFPCLAGTTFSEHQQKSILIWFMVNELLAIGGTNYTAALDSTLISDAINFAGQMDSSQWRTALLAIFRNNAVAAGATIATDPSSLLDSVKCLYNTKNPNLDKIILMLLCKLGVHKAYVQ